VTYLTLDLQLSDSLPFSSAGVSPTGQIHLESSSTPRLLRNTWRNKICSTRADAFGMLRLCWHVCRLPVLLSKAFPVSKARFRHPANRHSPILALMSPDKRGIVLLLLYVCLIQGLVRESWVPIVNYASPHLLLGRWLACWRQHAQHSTPCAGLTSKPMCRLDPASAA
jgi:hypothetical protein